MKIVTSPTKKKSMFLFLLFACLWSARQQLSFGQHSGVQAPDEGHFRQPSLFPPILLKSYFARGPILEICFLCHSPTRSNVFNIQMNLLAKRLLLVHQLIYLIRASNRSIIQKMCKTSFKFFDQGKSLSIFTW